MSRFSALTGAGLIAAMAFMGSGPATAALTAEQEATYKRMHMSIRAVEECRSADFGQGDHNRFADTISNAVGFPIGPGQLHLIHRGSWEGFLLVRQKGCDHPDVASLLRTFDENLAK